MRRMAVLTLLAAFVAACQDSQTPTPPGTGEAGGPSFAISDGTQVGGNDHLFFLTPIRPTPASFNGPFNPFAGPTVVITQVLGDPDLSMDCIQSGPEVARFTSEITVNTTREAYEVNWQTGEENGVISGNVYRICVLVLDRPLGYRDVGPQDDPVGSSRDVAQDPVYGFNNGRNLPLAFRIEVGAYCFGVTGCGEEVLGANGGQALCEAGQCVFSVAAGALPEESNILFAVELVDCGPVEADGRVHFLPTDIPQYPGCLELTAGPGFTGFTDVGGEFTIAGACLNAPGLSDDQHDLAQLLHLRDDGTVEALPNVAAPGLDCASFFASKAPPLVQFAQRTWRSVQRHLAPWFSPPPAFAGHKGDGGCCFSGESPMAWGLPVQMGQFNWTNPETGATEETKTATVLVTDRDGAPAQGATVNFEVTTGGGSVFTTPMTTGSNGLASFDWTLGAVAGLNEAEARGRGIGLAPGADGFYDPATTLPPTGSGPFDERLGTVVDLGTGVLDFEAVACAGVGIVVDGSADDWTNNPTVTTKSFTAKLSGGATPATVSWTNDCENLYVVVTVETDEESDNTSLRLIFDNDDDGNAETGDDILVLERVVENKTKTFHWEFSDHHLPEDCLNSKQSSCSAVDGVQHGAGEFMFDGTQGVYEFSHPLTGGGDQDFDLDVINGDTVGFYGVLQLGGGSKGNTEFSDFREYCSIEVNISGGGVGAAGCSIQP